METNRERELDAKIDKLSGIQDGLLIASDIIRAELENVLSFDQRMSLKNKIIAAIEQAGNEALFAINERHAIFTERTKKEIQAADERLHEWRQA
jgi:hypothetical protein